MFKKKRKRAPEREERGEEREREGRVERGGGEGREERNKVGRGCYGVHVTYMYDMFKNTSHSAFCTPACMYR